MRYKKLSLLLVISLVFFLVVSLFLICTWFYYYFYDSKKETVQVPGVKTSVAPKSTEPIPKMYTASMGTFDSTETAEKGDSLQADFNSKLNEFYKLRNEVTSMVHNSTGPKDLELARQKIGSLQEKIEALRSRTVKIEYENKRLNALLLQLSNELKGQQPTVRHKSVNLPRAAPVENIPAPVFTISDVNINAVSDKEPSDNDAEKSGKIEGSFTVRNNVSQEHGNELMVVVLQPDGKLLHSSDWESGSFETSEGKKLYSTRIVFDYNKGEAKKLSFFIVADELSKGEYVVQIYQHGVLVGKGSKTLF